MQKPLKAARKPSCNPTGNVCHRQAGTLWKHHPLHARIWWITWIDALHYGIYAYIFCLQLPIVFWIYFLRFVFFFCLKGRRQSERVRRWWRGGLIPSLLIWSRHLHHTLKTVGGQWVRSEGRIRLGDFTDQPGYTGPSPWSRGLLRFFPS